MSEPKDYRALASKVCDLIAESQYTTRAACEESAISRKTFYELIRSDEEIRNQYAHAKEIDAERLVDEILEIADGAERDYIVTEKGVIFQPEHVQRARLMVDTRKWIASKRLPKKYGDMLDVTTDGKPIAANTVSVVALADYVKLLSEANTDNQD